MEININQSKISIGHLYQVYVNGNQMFSASSKLFRLLPEIHLSDYKTGKLIYVIKKKWSFLKLTYDLLSPSHPILIFRTVSIWKNHFSCQLGNDLYEIYGHRGRKYSIYKNNNQVGWWDKSAVSWFNGDNYCIIADSDADIPLLISFCLIIDSQKSNDKDMQTVTYDFGNIGPQAKQFDASWKPKNKIEN
jgi:uncharacterized protein YxjI